ncbi:NADPH-dependent FMN reductase [Streptomyces odontomachi]|uniref:NADPH-dependent FMN reductase n=1 Tax=Streptomyces odontomachi TaxID=2944940 RepID=UPI00210B8E52|nr:NAD(P)H-dependent oxidoreductase [Streptomyces sp. ODS25]
MTTLKIITASTRPGRVGPVVGTWIEQRARAHQGFATVELVDLAEVGLPFMNEPHHPSLGDYTHQHTRDWSARVSAADALVFVMPEYNNGYNAELKNAIDYLHHEWHYKPVGLVSYGGISGGTRAAQAVRQVVTTLRMVPVAEAVAIPFVHRFIDNAELHPNALMTGAADAMLTELARVADVLTGLRAARV